MKKRKAPIMLVSMLVVLVGGYLVYSANLSRADAPPTPPTATGSETQPHEAPTNADLIRGVKGATPQATPAAVDTTPSEPSIGLHKLTGTYPKPKPNVSGTTSSQWYDSK